MKKILIPTKLDKIAANILKDSGSYIVAQDDSLPIEDLAKKHPDTFGLIVRSEKVTPEVIDALPELKIIVRAGAGFNTIDTKYARSKGIDVMNTPGANSNAVAEEVVALMLADARHIIAADASTREGKWEKKKFMGREIAGKTIGIIGLGYIGRLLAKRLSGFDVNLLGYDPVLSGERAADLNVELADIETIFSKADYISLHIPENKDTKGMINWSLLSMMKDGSTIVNCARAGIIDENDIRKAKKEKNIRLLNDVYDKDAEGHKPIADVANIMLPHLGANTTEANFNAAKRAAEQIIDLETKGITSFIVNRDIPEGLAEEYCELANTLAKLARSLAGKNATVKLIETSVYGSLKQYADWLIVPIVAGIWPDFNMSMDHHAAQDYLRDMGIEFGNRDVAPSKAYDASITVDVTCEIGDQKLRQMSIRGTVTEGVIMVSRINGFDKLYFEPKGFSVYFLYEDRPGVIGKIGVMLAENNINIHDIRNAYDKKSNRSLAIMKVSASVSDELIDKIKKEINAVSAFSIKI